MAYVKHIQSRWHSAGKTALSAPIGSFEGKDGLRVEVREVVTNKYYYFVFPAFSYELNSGTLEIPFSKDGSPKRQGSSWWLFEVGSEHEMLHNPIFNTREEYDIHNPNSLSSYFDFSEESKEENKEEHSLEYSVQHVVAQTITKDSVMIVKVNTGALPIKQAQAYMQNITDKCSDMFKPAKVLTVPHDTEITIINKKGN